MATTTININSTEQEILDGCVAGKRSAQEALYSYYSPKMFGICLRYASDYHTAEDILQEGFVKIFHNIHKFRGDGSFEGWMKRIFVNTAIEHFRKAFKFDELGVTNQPENTSESVNDTWSQLSTKDLLNLIQKLSPGYRTVFNMYVVEGYSHKEIAELLNISEGTSKSQLARARGLLQKMLRER
jgi:RNA polymerase sigma-70 factor (ECF subfamily)